MKRTVALLMLLVLLVIVGCVVPGIPGEERRKEKSIPPYYPRFKKAKLDALDLELLWDTNALYDCEIKSMFYFCGREAGKDYYDLFVETKGKQIYKIDGKSGEVKWVYNLGDWLLKEPCVYLYPKQVPGAPPVYNEVYFLTKDRLHCVEEANGALLWSKELRVPVSSPPFASESCVFVGAWTDWLFSIEKNDPTHTGDWVYKTGGDIVAGGREQNPSVFVASEDGIVYCFDAGTGEKTWDFKTGSGIVATPFFYRNRLYIGSTDYSLYSLHALSGLLDWEFPCGASIERSPVAIDGTVYAAAKNGYMFAVRRASCKFGTRTTKLKWKSKDCIQVLAKSKKHVYLLTDTRQICAIDNETGQVLWKDNMFKVCDFFVTNPQPGGKNPTIYLGFEDGYFCALKEKEVF